MEEVKKYFSQKALGGINLYGKKVCDRSPSRFVPLSKVGGGGIKKITW